MARGVMGGKGRRDSAHEDETPTAQQTATRRDGGRRGGPVSMLGWRRATRAFGETLASLPAVNGDATSSTGSTDGGPVAEAGGAPAEEAGRSTRDSAPARSAPSSPHASKRSDVSDGSRAKPVVIAGARPAGAPLRPTDVAGRPTRSPVGRMVLFAAIVATVFASLAVAVPAGAGGSAGFTGVFQSYANAMPWSAPTATPHPRTPVVNLNASQQTIAADIQAVFGPNAAGAINVARCESGLDPHAWNPIAIGSSHASGVFQILYPSTWNGTSYAKYSPYDEWANVRAAYEIFKRDGYSWREWQCQP